MKLLLGIRKEVQRWNQLLLLARTTVAWVTLIETGSEQEGASPFSLIPASDLPWRAGLAKEICELQRPSPIPKNRVEVGGFEAEEQFLYNQHKTTRIR